MNLGTFEAKGVGEAAASEQLAVQDLPGHALAEIRHVLLRGERGVTTWATGTAAPPSPRRLLPLFTPLLPNEWKRASG